MTTIKGVVMDPWLKLYHLVSKVIFYWVWLSELMIDTELKQLIVKAIQF